MLSARVVAVVLLAAALHAGWNVVVRAGSDRRRESALLLAGGTLIAIVALPFLPVPPAAAWPYLVISSVLNGVFFVMLAEAYAHGGVALAYPLMRGVAPMITLLGSWLLLGETLPMAGWIGIATICGGVVLLARRRGDAGEATAVRFALLNAVVIATYTMNDAVGVRIAQTPLAYTLWLYPLSALPTLLWLSRKTPLRWPSGREAARGIAGAGASIGAYSLVLWAFTQAPVAPVAALRETSILLGVVLARVLLDERPGRRGWSGAAAIAAGAAILRLA
ncbi:MAG TPA: EamA family transporter [Acetobacteraceae bacterium]|nr:EamA family transporter [Acetobacteraceae bacterium]